MPALLIALLLAFSMSCAEQRSSDDNSPQVIDGRASKLRSSSAGNLMASAIQNHYQVDMVFYPSDFVSEENVALIEAGMDPELVKEKLLSLYPSDRRDELMIGTLSGREIRKFILARTSDAYQIDLQVAGIEYDLQFTGGLPTVYQINRTHGVPLEDKKNYRIAISRFAYGIPYSFPGYQYRNSFENSFEREPGSFSARAALTAFLSRFRQIPRLNEPRASIAQRVLGEHPSPLSIASIQGRSHLSPWAGYTVQTEGIITAVASKADGGMEIYIQAAEDDGDPLSSNALNVYLQKPRADLKPGQLIAVKGVVYEIMTAEGLTRTALREVSELSIRAENQPLPPAVLIGGSAGLKVPTKAISTHRGNLNQKENLKLADGVDFWESLEAMRVRVASPRVVGFRGGKEKLDDEKSGYLTVLVVPEGVDSPEERTGANGTFLDPHSGNYTPEVLRIVANELAPEVTTDLVFNVGDRFDADLEGILSFQTNTFGSGEFVFYVTGSFPRPTSSIKPLDQRPVTRLTPDADHLTYVSWNVENLSADRRERINRVAEAIEKNLRCPDIVSMPEIQDNNGITFEGGSAANETLGSIISQINCPGARYQPINIDPVPNQDGGEPGGNIRVAMIYNAARVQFTPWGAANALSETTLLANGRLNQNPGRLYPSDLAFQRSRKPLVAEFGFRGQRFVTIGNHLNSKLGDSSLWQAEQPAEMGSERQRSLIASRINRFVSEITEKDPDAHVIVSGDFNAYWFENSMRILAGDRLFNLMTYGDLLPPRDWYTTNYDGGASAIDFIFASPAFLKRSPELEILHINSNYMGKLSDHDPVVSRFDFSANPSGS